jgi:hypothetical protein
MNILLVFTTIVIVAILVLLIYSGYYQKIKIWEQEMGPYTVVYKEHKGDYSKIKTVMDSVYASLKKEGIETTRGVGIYYDNPMVTPKEELKSLGGCILEENQLGKVSELQSKNYLVKQIDKKQSLVTEFPFTTPLSIMLGVVKVYPEINRYIKEKGYKNNAIMEIYDMLNKKITYRMELN